MSVSSSIHGAATTILSNLFIRLPVPHGPKDLSEQTIVVTGANTGLGLETCRHLLRNGVGKLVMGVRNEEKGEAARRDLLNSTGRAESSTEVWQIDMDNYDSVKKFARRTSHLDRLDGVLANAGMMTTSFSLSEGNEKTFNVNVISTFLLCLLLLPAMRKSESRTGNKCRFVIPNSALHYLASISELEPTEGIICRLNDSKTANMDNRYPLSKLLVLYVVRELANRVVARDGRLPIINSPNPSYCKSGLTREDYGTQVQIAEKLLARTTEEGSRVLYHGLFAGKESHGQYLTNCHVQIPACHVTSKTGEKIQVAFFDELLETLERIEPGISANLQSGLGQ